DDAQPSAVLDLGSESIRRMVYYSKGHKIFHSPQLFAISLPYPVLDVCRWKAVVDVVYDQLLTPYGLRSLAPGHPDYRPPYFGDLRARDLAYHQGRCGRG